MPALHQLLSVRLSRKIAAAQLGEGVVAAAEFLVASKESPALKALHPPANGVGRLICRFANNVDVVVDLLGRPHYGIFIGSPHAVYELEDQVIEFVHARDPRAHIPNERGISLSRFGDNSTWSIALIRGILNPLMEYIIQKYKVLWGVKQHRPCAGLPRWVPEESDTDPSHTWSPKLVTGTVTMFNYTLRPFKQMAHTKLRSITHFVKPAAHHGSLAGLGARPVALTKETAQHPISRGGVS